MTETKKVTFIIPCRNNLRYLKQAIKSIEDNYGEQHDVIILDDASTDGTWEWISSLTSKNIKTYRNNEVERVGHTVLYDIGIDMANTEVVTILHSDMIVTKNYISNMLKHLKPRVVVSGTRIEPPLHPPGPEKHVKNFGMEPDEFDHLSFDNYVSELEIEKHDQITRGIFAPWMLHKKDFVNIGGHDKLFAPMELEDSDIFNRFHIQGYDLIQSRDAFVYHMTCRGSRFKDGIQIERVIDLPDGTKWYKPKDSEEYLKLRNNKFREWWRKWHTDVLHDDLMLPIVPNRYDTAFVVHNCNQSLLGILEPWCDRMYVDCDFTSYAESENINSMFDIDKKIYNVKNSVQGSIQIIFDGSKLTNQLYAEFIKKIPFIVEQTGDVGTFEWNIFTIKIVDKNTMDMSKPYFKNIF